MRFFLLYGVVIFFSVYAYFHWFRSLCVLILFMAVIEHPDMPKAILNIQGLNPWNILFFNVLIAWLIHRRGQNYSWDLPRRFNILLLLYLLIVLVGFIRAMMDRTNLEGFTPGGMISEYLVNTIKFTLPGLMLFDGCRSVPRLKLGIASVLIIYVLLALQVIQWMPLGFVSRGADLEARSRKVIEREVGYSRVNMSMILSGASWAVLAMLPLASDARRKFLIVGGFLIIAYAQALTGGRMGYLAWGMIGLTLGLFRWRKLLPVIPVFIFIVFLVAPGVFERMLEGFNKKNIMGQQYVDEYEVTAGRTIIWPFVLDKIGESPYIGFGRLSLKRTGLADFFSTRLNEVFEHPHNAYLEWLLDNGILGFLVIIPFYILVLVESIRLLIDRKHPWCSVVGGVSLALVMALLLAGFGSQTFYPREGSVGMWCAIGLMLRMSVEREKALRRAYSIRYKLSNYVKGIAS